MIKSKDKLSRWFCNIYISMKHESCLLVYLFNRNINKYFLANLFRLVANRLWDYVFSCNHFHEFALEDFSTSR